MSDQARRHIVVGVSGGVAAYKGLELVRLLTERGYEVTVIPTLSALRFVGEASFAALSGNPVHTDLWADVQNVPHIKLARSADLVMVVPTTADLLARAATGRADDLLTATLLTATCPVLLAPAMHTEMWLNSATQENVQTLRARGITVLEPAVGRLTGSDSGPGRLPDPTALADAAEVRLLMPTDFSLVGKRVVVTAGGTREAIDPVRFIGNRSSGKQGYAFATVAAAAGATVDLISANVQLTPPAGCAVHQVVTAEQLQSTTLQAAQTADYVVMTAAVADFRPEQPAEAKLKKETGGLSNLHLIENDDVLAALVGQRKPGQKIIGFAAETEVAEAKLLELGQAKFQRKGCDYLVVNQVGGELGFESDQNEGWLISSSGKVKLNRGSKLNLAATVWHLVK